MLSPSGALGLPGPQESTQAYHAGKGGRSQTGLCHMGRLPDHCFMEASWSGSIWRIMGNGTRAKPQNMDEQCLGSRGPSAELDGGKQLGDKPRR